MVQASEDPLPQHYLVVTRRHPQMALGNLSIQLRCHQHPQPQGHAILTVTQVKPSQSRCLSSVPLGMTNMLGVVGRSCHQDGGKSQGSESSEQERREKGHI